MTGNDLVDIHAEYISKHMLDMLEEGVENPKEYFEHENGGDIEEVGNRYEDYPMEVVFSISSCTPSDIMVILRNPGLSNSSVVGCPGGTEILLNQNIEFGTQKLVEQQKDSQDWDSWEDIELTGDLTAVRENIQWNRRVKVGSFSSYLRYSRTEAMKEFISGDGGDSTGLGNIDSDIVELSMYHEEGEPESESANTAPDVKSYLEPKQPDEDRHVQDESIPSHRIAKIHDDFYFTNYSKFRGKSGSTPSLGANSGEIRKGYLLEEIKAVDPNLIVTMGTPAKDAIRRLDGNSSDDGRMRTCSIDNQSYPWIWLYHPAYTQREYEDHITQTKFETIDLK